MNSILAELESKSIITSDAGYRIRSHIVSRNLGIPDSRRAVIHKTANVICNYVSMPL